jgi:cobalt transporter subunit CbtA
MFTRLLTSALFAGFAAGLIAAILQFLFVQPVLLHAELYESGAVTHFGATGSDANGPGWSFDALRDGFSILFSALIYVGYALILIAAIALADEQGMKFTPRQGLLWGLAGFVTFQFAPGFSLPPEVPGVAAADVSARQVWWFFTAATTAIGLSLFAFGTTWFLWGIGGVLILLPHVIGSPQPHTFVGTVPPEIASLFVSRSLGVGIVIWSLLGILSVSFWNQSADQGT